MGLTLQEAVTDLYRRAREQKAKTSTKRLELLARYCVQELAERGLDGAAMEPELPGFARPKDWDVAWFHHGKVRLAISLKSLLANISGAVPNRVDDLIGEAANLQLYSPETVIGYIMLFNVEEDEHSKKHGSTWSQLLQERLRALSGRRAPHWTIGTIEAFAFVEVDFKSGPNVVSGDEPLHEMFDTLVAQVRERNPDLPNA